MNLIKTLAATTVAAIALSSAAYAHSFTRDCSDCKVFKDIDLGGKYEYKYLSEWGTSSFYGTFNILKDGYDPNTMFVKSAWVSFAFADDFDDGKYGQPEYVNIYLDWSPFITYKEVDGNIWSYDWVSGGLNGTFLADLQDGKLDYKVKLKKGDAYLKEAKLIAKGCEQVPDGGATAALLGAGLLACVAFKRRK